MLAVEMGRNLSVDPVVLASSGMVPTTLAAPCRYAVAGKAAYTVPLLTNKLVCNH